MDKIPYASVVGNIYVCYETICYALWLRNFLHGLYVIDSILRPLTIYCDNGTVVRFSTNNELSRESKHNDIKYLIMKERLLNQSVSITHIGTTLMLDHLTKALHQSFLMNMLRA